MQLPPQLRLALGLVAILASTTFVADLIGLLPKPEQQLQETRRVVAESLAIQLSRVAGKGDTETIVATLREVVERSADVAYASLSRQNGMLLAEVGDKQSTTNTLTGNSTTDQIIVPIFEGSKPWGSVKLNFMPVADWGLRYLGFSSQLLGYLAFISVSCLLCFYLFLRKALIALNPARAVPERVNAAFDVLTEGVLIVDERGRAALVNTALQSHLGMSAEQLIGKDPTQLPWDLSGDEEQQLPWQLALRRGEAVNDIPLRLMIGDREVTFTTNAAPITDVDGNARGVLVTLEDVTPLQAKNQELAQMLAELNETHSVIEKKNRELETLATRDPLTNALNRRSFVDRLTPLLQDARHTGSPISLIMVDIDHFKQVNDTYGHPVGDAVIKAVADLLAGSFRRQDRVGRFGGEEFVVALEGCDAETGLRLAEKVRQRIEKFGESGKLPISKLTASLGVAPFDASISSYEELLERADKAMYKAKQTGRNRVCLYDADFEISRPTESPIETSPNQDEIDGIHSQLQKMQEVVTSQAHELTHRSLHDDLTGLPNRYLLIDRLGQAIRLSKRDGTLTAVISIGLSQYKSIRELHGLELAEDLIRRAAARIDHVVREADSLGVTINEQASTSSRIANNELAMLAVAMPGPEALPIIIDRITGELEKPFSTKGRALVNLVHCGIALYPHDGDDPDVLIRNATLARSHAEERSAHASASTYFSRDLDALARKNSRIAIELQSAIANNSLELAYQAKVDAETQSVTGMEALARWHHPELGHVGPDEFVTVAENTGVIDQLTNWVLDQVCRDIKQYSLADLRVSINVSPIELCNRATADRLLNRIQQANISPTQIEVEITESSVLKNFDAARQTLEKLKRAGVLVALDDFGTAYSSLNLLIEIPVDIIKIDRSFVTDLHTNRENQAVVRAIIDMARSMRKRVVAEGVETDEEALCLRGLGCREIQGYLYSHPMPVTDMTGYIQERGIMTARYPAAAKPSSGSLSRLSA